MQMTRKVMRGLVRTCVNIATEAVGTSNRSHMPHEMEVAVAAVLLEHCLKNDIKEIDLIEKE